MEELVNDTLKTIHGLSPTTTCPHCHGSWQIGGKANHAKDCVLLNPITSLGAAELPTTTMTMAVNVHETAAMRTFETGATRSPLVGKPSYLGYLSPLVLERYGRYMLAHQVQEDGQVREAGNWKKGMPRECYLDSALRHVMDWWLLHEGFPARTEDKTEALCGVLFNVMGALLEALKEQQA